MGKPVKTKKRYPYRVVEGIENYILDACLLFSVPRALLINDLKSQPKLLKDAGVSFGQIKSSAVPHVELIQKLSRHLYEHYLYWNHLFTNWYDNGGLSSILSHAERLESLGTGTDPLEEWAYKGQKLVDEKKVLVFEVVNVLRFYNFPRLHPLIKPFLEQNAVSYYFETGIKLGEEFEIPSDIDWELIDKASNTVDDEFFDDGAVEEEFTNPDTVLENSQQVMESLKQDKFGTLEQGIDFAIDILRSLKISDLSESAASKEQIAELTLQLKTERDVVERLRSEKSELQNHFDAAKVEVEQLLKDVKSLNRSHESSINKMLKKHESELKSKSKECEVELKSVRKELKALIKEHEDLKKKYEELQETLMNPEVAVSQPVELETGTVSIEDYIYVGSSKSEEKESDKDNFDIDEMDLSAHLDDYFDFKPVE